MKNSKIIFVVIAVVAVLGISAYSFSQNSSQSDSMMNVDTQDSLEKNEAETMRYVEYSKTALESASDNRRVLFFYASWCPTCRPADASFKANVSRISSDMTVIRVNYNDPETDLEEKELAKKYGITYQHTYVQIDSAGKEIVKWNGGQINELLSNIK